MGIITGISSLFGSGDSDTPASPVPPPPAPTQDVQPPGLLSASQFAAKIREKYPKAYDGVDDHKLAKAFLEKYPVYKAKVEPQLAHGDAGARIGPQPEDGFTDRVARALNFKTRRESDDQPINFSSAGNEKPAVSQDAPLVDFKQLMTSTRTESPTLHAIADTASGLTTPQNVAIGVATAGLGKAYKAGKFLAGPALRVISGYFATQMGAQTLESLPELKDAYDKASKEPSKENISNLVYKFDSTVLGGALTIAAAHHAARGEGVAKGKEVAQTLQDEKATPTTPKKQLSPVAPPPAPEPTPVEEPTPQLQPLNDTHAGQAADIHAQMKGELDKIAYERGHGNAQDLVAEVRDRASKGEELNPEDQRILQLAEGKAQGTASAKEELDKLAYEAGYGNTGDYVRAVRDKQIEDRHAEAVIQLANDDSFTPSTQAAEPPAVPAASPESGQGTPPPPTTVPGNLGTPGNTPEDVAALKKKYGIEDKPKLDEVGAYKPGAVVNSVPGRETVIQTPNGDYKAHYRVVEAEDLKPSHDPKTFDKNPNYPEGVQERQYHSNKNAQFETQKYADEGKWSLYVNNDPTSVNGPSQSLPDGTVLGGNGRTMSLIRAYAQGSGDAYKQYLIEHAADFGLGPAKIAEMKHPVLDRMITNAPLHTEGLRRLGADLNKSFAKKTSLTETAVSTGKNLSQVSADKIGEGLAGLGEDGSIRKLMTENPALFRDTLLRDGIMKEGELPQYFDSDGTLNDAGKDYIENMLMGSVIRDADLLGKLPDSVKDKIQRAISPLMELSGRTDGWNIVDDTREAAKLFVRAQAEGNNVKDLVRQEGFGFGQEQVSVDPRVADIAVGMTKKPTVVAGLFKQFAAEARNNPEGQNSMFSGVTPEEAISDIFAGGKSKGADASLIEPARGPAGVAPPPRPPTGRAPYREIPTRPMGGVTGEFFHETLKPEAKAAFEGFASAAKGVRDAFAPGGQLRVKLFAPQDTAKLSMAKRGAEQTFTMYQVDQALAPIRSFFQKMTRVEQMHATSMLDAGRATDLGKELGTPEVVTWAATMRQMREAVFDQAMKMKGVEKDLLRKDYWLARFYETVDGEPISSLLSHRKIEGPKSFFKARKWPSQADFIQFAKDELGVEVRPKYQNPVDAETAKIREMTQFIVGHGITEDLKGAGLEKIVHAMSMDIPEGYEIPQDKSLATIYAPPNYTVSEAFDQLLSDRLRKLADSLGIQHSRRVKIGGDGRWGYSEKGEGKISSKVGGPLDVVTHEIGHVIDDKYGLAKKWVGDPWVKDELRKLADLRFEGQDASDAYKSYVRKGSEKIANLVAAYVHNREQATQVAPNAVRYLESLMDEHEELAPLRDVKPSMVLGSADYKVPTGTVNIMGYRAYPKEVVRLLNNWTSQGIASNPTFGAAFRGFRYLGNAVNSSQLSFSAFHGLFASFDAASSKASLGIQQMLDGNFKLGLTNLAKGNVFAAPIDYALKDSAFMKNVPKFGEDLIPQTRMLLDGGGAMKMGDIFHNNAIQSFFDAFHSGNKLGAGIHSIPAFMEFINKPIMEQYVPMLKRASYLELADYELSKLPAGASPEEKLAVQRRAWDSIDNRLGQVVYNNFFWNRVLKDLMMLSGRSVGWNTGFIREFGGAAVDLSKGLKRAVTAEASVRDIVTPRLAYAVTLPIVVGLHGALAMYMFTGKGPDELKDYFAPKTGKLNADGTPERIMLPTYMKDHFSYFGGFRNGPASGFKQLGTAASHKIHPLVTTMFEMMENKDFYGTEIRNPDDPMVKQMMEIGEYVVGQFKPMSARNADKMLDMSGKTGTDAIFSKESIRALFGILPASKSLDRTKTEQMLAEYVAEQLPRGARTNDQFEKSKLRNEIAEGMRLQDPQAFQKMKEAVESGKLDHGDIATIRSRVRYSWVQSMANHVNLQKALNAYDAGTPEEKRALAPILMRKQRELFSLPAEVRDKYVERLKQIAAEQTPAPMGQIPLPPQ